MVTAEPATDSNASFLRAARAGNLEKVLEFLKGNIDINTSNANGLNALHLASKEGHVNVVTELLKRGANANAATKKGNTALHIASLAGQYEVVKVLVNLGANVNVQSQNGFTPLYMAAQENHDNVVSFLLANGANQSLATEDGFTPLAVALQQGHDKVVAVLLENDTKGKVRLPALHIAAKKDDCKAATLLLQNDHNPDVTSKSGFTPLHIAAHYGNENIANILLDKGADVNYAAKHQITPLHVASKWGKSNMVTLLLDKGANIEASTRDGLTPLHCAARSGHNQVVDLLLERGAPILAKTKNGLAPLHMASQGDHVDSARILLYHKAPVDDVTVDYLTALHVAAHCGHVKVAKLLLERKADANARALNGFTPLHIACKKNRIKVVELLLKHGASIEATTESGLTPLHVASFMGCMNIVIYLIQNGANPDVPTVRGETPLHLAARANQTDIIRILLRNGANVDARAREEQTPLHIAARLGNVDIVSLLLQHGAAVDATTKDMYTALHIAAKEDQEEVASVLLDHGASLTATTKKGFTPLHLAAKYGNIKVARLLLQKDAPVDAQGKNGVTPLHVASHYDHVNVALLLLDKGASPHAMAKNGYTPLHIAAKKNQMDIATTLLEYGAKANSESKAGFTPLHLASQEGHTDMTTLLIEHQADVNFKANNGLTPLHLSAQEDRVNVATVLVKNGAEIGPQTKAGYTPLHVASHFGQINMVRFLLQQNADVHMTTSHGYTPLHQAAQQGHTLVVNLLLENQASPNVTTSQGQTALSIAQRLGYISVVETLKVVTETTVTTTTTTVTEEKYKVVAPETMQETFMTDSEDEGGEDAMLGDQSYRYLTADEMKSLGDDSLPIDVTKDEKQHEAIHPVKESPAPMVEEDHISPQHITPVEVGFSEKYSPDNVDLSRAPVHAGYVREFDWDDTGYFSLPSQGMLRSSRLKWKTFLVSFMVDARGGAMRGCRHSGVRVIIPPRKASMPMRITCRYLRKEKLIHPPPLMEGEACASRILEVGPIGARFLGPVIIEVPHFASLRGKEREITILRSDTGETWREHTLEASEEAVQEVLNESFEGDELSALEDLNTNRITRILTTDFPQYFAIVTRIRQEVHGVGPEGGMVSSTVVPQVQAIFPDGALTKKIRVGLQAQPIAPELVAKLLGNRVAVSPIVTVEPRRRKFHKPIKLTIPVPQAATKGMINQYSGDAPTLRLLCSITGGSSKAQWEDVTGSTPLTFVNDCVSFTTTVSARFWLMDCRQVNEASKFATELYQEAVHVPFMSKFVIFAKRNEPNEAHLRVFCMTDDKEDKTLETQENFTEIAKSRDVEVLEGKMQYLEFAGNLVPVTKSGEQLKLAFQAFHENRLAFTIRVKDPHVEPMGRIAFMKEPKVGRGEPPQVPICNLNVALPEVVVCDTVPVALELVTLEKRDDFIQESGLSKPESIHRADLRLSDIARELDKDWVALAQQLEISESDINVAKSEFPEDISEQALTMLRLWLQKAGSRATGNELEKALRKINRDDIIKKCMFNVELVTDDVEKAVAKVHLDQSGFDVFKEELGSSREASMRRGASLDISYDEQDIMKDAESAAETSSETGSIFERDQISQVFSDEKEDFPLLHDDKPIPLIVAENGNTPIYSDAEIDESIVKEHEDITFSTFPNTTQVPEIHEAEDFGSITDTENWIQDNNIVTCVTEDGSGNEYFSPSPSNMSNSDIGTLSYSDRLNTSRSEADQHDSMELIETDILLKEEYKSYSEPHADNREQLINNTNTLKSVKSQMEDFKEADSYFSNDDSTYSSHNEFVDNEHPSPLDTSFETPCYTVQGGQNEETGVFNGSSNKLPFEEFTDKITAEIIEMASSAKLDDFKDDVEPLTDYSISEISESEDLVVPSVPGGNIKEVTIDPFICMDQKEHMESDSLVAENHRLDREEELVIHSQNTMIENIQDDHNEKYEEIPVSGIPFSVLKVVETTIDVGTEIPQYVKQETFEDAPEKISEQIFPCEVITPETYTVPEDVCLEVDPSYEFSCESSKTSEILLSSPPSDDSGKAEVTSDIPKSGDRFIEEARIRRVSKTPPPSPAEMITKDFVEEKSTVEENVLIENEVLEKEDVVTKQEVPTPPPKPIETVDEMMKPMTEVPEVAAKQTESETWPSGEMDTSQVSVSSLPDDEKSETTTATVSSATAADAETETKVVETKEWTETDDSGAIKHVIQKTTHMTLSMQQKSDEKPDEEVPAKETISETQVSMESGDLQFLDSSLEDKSARRQEEIFRNDGYIVISDQSDFKLNSDHDILEQTATEPKQEDDTDIQETSSYSTCLGEPEVTECYPEYVFPSNDGLESAVKSEPVEMLNHSDEVRTLDMQLDSNPDLKTESAGFVLEPKNNQEGGYLPLEAEVGFHTIVRDFESEPADVTLEEIVSDKVNVEQGTEPPGESVNQHIFEIPDFGETENFQKVRNGVDITYHHVTEDIKDDSVPEKESKVFTGFEFHHDLKVPELDIPHEDTMLITELEYEYDPDDSKYDEMSKPYISEPQVSSIKLDHQHTLGDHIHDESSKISITELEFEPVSELGYQTSFQDCRQGASVQSNILEAEPAKETQDHFIHGEVVDREISKTSLVEGELEVPYTTNILETEPATDIDHHIHDDIFSQKTYETNLSERELEIPNIAKDELEEDPHCYEKTEYQEICKGSIPEERTVTSEKSEYDPGSECFESIVAGELYESEQIIDSGLPYILQSLEHGAVITDPKYAVHPGILDENKMYDKPDETVEPCGTLLTSSSSENVGTHTDYCADNSLVPCMVPGETGTTEKYELSKSEHEIVTSACDSDLSNAPTLIAYSDEHVHPICISELNASQYGVVVDSHIPAPESIMHENFEITEQNLDSTVCDISSLEQSAENNGTIIQPGMPANLLSHSFSETEDVDQRQFGDSIQDTNCQNKEEMEKLHKNAEEASCSNIQDENLELHHVHDEILKQPTECGELRVTDSLSSPNESSQPADDQSDVSQKGNIAELDSPVELLVAGIKDSPEEICFIPEQQQLKYVSFTSPRPLSSHEIAEIPIKSESIIHHDENLYDGERVSKDFLLSDFDLQSDIMMEEHASPDLLKPESEVVNVEVTSHLPDDVQPEEEPVRVCDTQTEHLESKEHPTKEIILTQVTTERLQGPDDSEILVQSSVATVQSTTIIRTSVEDVSSEPDLPAEIHSEKFVPLAFVNTAFVGADLIDAAEEAELSRSRSPYEVLREELVTAVGNNEKDKTTDDDVGISGDVVVTDLKDYSGQVKHVVKSEVRRRPILQHIPSEISEEDLVEREISSPVFKVELSPELVDENLVEDRDGYCAKTGAVTEEKSEKSMEESLIHGDTELKVCEEVYPAEVTETKEESISDETGIKNIRRTVVTKTVVTKTSQILGDSADDSVAMKSETSSEYRKASLPLESVDQEPLEITEETKVPKDSDTKAGSVCETPAADITAHMETEICELTSPESDTGVPTSPFECTSEVDLTDGEHKSGEIRDVIVDSKQLSKTEEHKDSLLTSTPTFTQSFSEILNVSVGKITDSVADSTLDERKSAHEAYLSADDSFCDIESISHTSPKKSVVCDTKTDVYDYSCQESFAPQINGPVQVDYKPEYDDEEFRVEELQSVCDVPKTEVVDTVLKGEVAFAEEELGPPEEFLGAVGGIADVDFLSAETYKECTSSDSLQRSGDSLADAEPGKPYFYGSVSDDTVDAEIGKILNSKAETEEDIIERPRTPEPPEEVHLSEVIESSVKSRETEVFHGDHPIEKTKRTIEGVLDIDVTTNSLKFQLTSSTSHSEWDTMEGTTQFKEQVSVPAPRTLEELHIESPMQLPTELSAVGAAPDADSTLSPSITQSSCISEDSSGFVYGMQFEKESEEPEEAMDIDSDQCSDEKDTSYTYGMRFEREHELDDEDDDIPGYGDLYTHQEEDEDVIDEGEKVKMQFSSSRPLTYEKPSYSEYDTLAGRKCFGKANELDDISMSSLQEFEKLEEEIVSGRKSSIGSVDSFNGKQIHSKSGDHDDVSMNSLTEFEKLERECAEAERAEAISQEVNARLSEIEEGHESQSSEASQETISDAAREDDSDVSDFDDRLNKIDKIIREAQSNVDFFGDKSAVSILSQATDQKSDVFSDDSLSISAAKKVEEIAEVTDTGSVQKLPESSTDASDIGQSCVQEFYHQETDSPDVITTTVVKEIRNADGSISKITTKVTEKKQVTKISSTVSADRDIIPSSEQSFTMHKKEDIDQDSLHEDKSIKPDSLCGEEKFEYQDSLHEDKSADIDSLQEEVPDIMKDSLHEERPLDEDSLHEMDILPDESSLSLETSLAAAIDPCQEPGKSDDSEFAYMLQPQTHDQDIDTDSLKDLNVGDILESAFAAHVREVALADSGRVGDAMISSTDSLERSSSAATHATYQFETESVMSSSINSVQTSDDYTMVSSTDTVDPDIKISYGFSGASMSDIHFLTKDGQQKVFIDSEGNIQTQQDLKVFTDVEGNIQNTVMIPSESGNYETCTATVTYDEGMKQIKSGSPIVWHHSEDTDESQSEYTDKSSCQFDPDVEIEEIQMVDDKGNPVTVRRVKRIVTTKSQTFTASSSGDDIEEKFKQFLKDHAGGSDAGKGEEEFEEERRIDEKGNVIIVRTVKQQMLTEPEIHSKSFRGLDAEDLSSNFIKSFQIDPTETTEQYEKVDDDGNIVRVTQKVVMKPEMHALTFSGPDAHRQMEEYMKQWTASKDDSRSQDSTFTESSPCSSKVTDASQLHYITSLTETAPCDSFGSQISSGETSQSHSAETTVDTQPGHVTTRQIVTTTTTVHHIPEDDRAFPSSPVVSGETRDSHQGAHDDSCHLSSEHHSSFQVDDH